MSPAERGRPFGPDPGEPLASDLDAALAATAGLWDDLRGARLFITGGTGFFGCWLLETLLRADEAQRLGVSVVVLSRDPQRFVDRAPHLAQHPAVALLQGDMASFEFPTGSFDAVIHAATETGDPAAPVADRLTDPLRKFDSDLAGVRRALELAHERGARRFLFTSSGAVYGRQPADLGHVPEDYRGAPDPLDVVTAYGHAKRAGEFLCATSRERFGLETVVARCFAFVGPYLPLDGGYAIGEFIADALAGGPIRVTGDGTPYRSYLYAADLAVWLWTLLCRGTPGRAYNVGSDEALTIGELAAAVARVVAPRAEVVVAGRPHPGAPAERYVPSTARAQGELGLRRRVTLQDAIARTAAWHANRESRGG
ncbi:MAG TPA: NAD-dependent epimerase/dehydratase family protein [Thermoleophilia bacterium]|nr:NAD-dependent epimerase/dehydratase family protein [Thermoleophilia bacterium]